MHTAPHSAASSPSLGLPAFSDKRLTRLEKRLCPDSGDYKTKLVSIMTQKWMGIMFPLCFTNFCSRSSYLPTQYPSPSSSPFPIILWFNSCSHSPPSSHVLLVRAVPSPATKKMWKSWMALACDFLRHGHVSQCWLVRYKGNIGGRTPRKRHIASEGCPLSATGCDDWSCGSHFMAMRGVWGHRHRRHMKDGRVV